MGDALQRDTAERSAIEQLRTTLAQSESLAVLKPRLANLENWIADLIPPDRSAEIGRLEAHRDRLAALSTNIRFGGIHSTGVSTA